MRRVQATSLFLAAVALAGCASAEPDMPPAASLADFTECSFTYPDGSPVTCRDEATRIQATIEMPALADGWVCESGHGGYASYSRPDDETRIGASYPSVPIPAPLHGLFTIESATAVQSLSAWESTPERHFVEVRREPGQGPNAGLILYQVTVDTDHPALVGVEPTFLWTLWQGHPWLVFEFATASGSYWFHSMVEFPSAARNSYFPAHLDIQGSDFHLGLRLWNSGGYGWGQPSPDVGCALFGPANG